MTTSFMDGPRATDAPGPLLLQTVSSWPWHLSYLLTFLKKTKKSWFYVEQSTFTTHLNVKMFSLPIKFIPLSSPKSHSIKLFCKHFFKGVYLECFNCVSCSKKINKISVAKLLSQNDHHYSSKNKTNVVWN